MRRLPKRTIVDNIDSILSEDAIQAKVVNWVRSEAGNRPELECLYHVPNGGFRHPREAAKLKGMGVVRGVPDLELATPSGRWHSLRIEMKCATGKLSEEQKKMIERLRKYGNYVAVCYDSDSAIKTIETYLDKPEELEVET